MKLPLLKGWAGEKDFAARMHLLGFMEGCAANTLHFYLKQFQP